MLQVLPRTGCAFFWRASEALCPLSKHEEKLNFYTWSILVSSPCMPALRRLTCGLVMMVGHLHMCLFLRPGELQGLFGHC